jgi:hypothetical protein
MKGDIWYWSALSTICLVPLPSRTSCVYDGSVLIYDPLCAGLGMGVGMAVQSSVQHHLLQLQHVGVYRTHGKAHFLGEVHIRGGLLNTCEQRLNRSLERSLSRSCLYSLRQSPAYPPIT